MNGTDFVPVVHAKFETADSQKKKITWRTTTEPQSSNSLQFTFLIVFLLPTLLLRVL